MIRRFNIRAAAIVTFSATLLSSLTHAQLILNEANAVSDTEGPGFLAIDTGKPYEGYDYGVLPYSGNTNLPTNAMDPGNPFAPDVSGAQGTQTGFVDGFDTITNPRGFARIQHNGGEWIELTVTHDHTDLRGVTFHWVDDFNDNNIFGELRSQNGTLTEDERGAVRFANHPQLANLRAGTIITISENAFVNEVRDDYPFGFFNTGLDDTGHDYDLSTDTSFDAFDGADDWHMHFHLDESVTAGATPTDTEFFTANSELEVSNEQWGAKLLDASTQLMDTIRDPSLNYFELDVLTGEMTELVGENDGLAVGFGLESGGGGVGDDESMAMLSNPDSGEVGNGYYEDVDWSSFGMPNLFNMRNDVADVDGDGVTEGDIVFGALEDDTTLSQVQDFSGVRDPVRNNTYDWAGGSGDFGTAGSWELANDNSAAMNGPAANWSVRLGNDVGGDQVATVSMDTTIEFATVAATTGTMKLQVENGSTLTVTGATRAGFETPGRLLVFDGGIVETNGVIEADVVEVFNGGQVMGIGSVTGHLVSSDGTLRPGTGNGGTLTVGGDFVQSADALTIIDITGNNAGEFGAFDISGNALIDGDWEIAINGFSPSDGTSLTVLSSSGLVDNGINLVGDANGVSFSIVNGTDLVLTFMGSLIDGDFNNDGNYDCADIDLLTSEIAGGGNNGDFDLTGDGSVDLADRDAWLAEAGAENLPSGNAYLLGDANLDGVVDGQDFIAWNGNKFSNLDTWCGGDFNADGVVDGQDFIAWNGNKFTSADGVHAVPEPTLPLGALLLIAAGYLRRRR